MRGTKRISSIAGLILIGLASVQKESTAQSIQVTDRALLVPGNTIEVVPGERYRASGLRAFLFGARNRTLWTTAIRVPVIDLDAFSGGITAFRTGGFGQTNTLHFRTEQGRRFTFRSVDKSPERGLPEDLRGTVVADVRQDFVSALNPGAALVAAPILEAAGVIHVNPQLIVLPDSPRLGEFRDAFAGMLGYVEERPNEGPDGGPGFAGLTSIVGDERIEELLEEGPANRVDAREFLTARLVDFLLGDRDRHRGQWRWGRIDADADRSYWAPIPEDRDEALIRYSGLMMTLYTRLVPKIVSFGPDYPGISWLAFNGWDLDRRFLPELDAAQWEATVRELQAALTDEVVADAVAQLPRAFQEVQGAWVRNALMSRRDALLETAMDYYSFLLREVEITATDADEAITLEYRSDGIRVAIHSEEEGGGSSASPYYERLFLARETDELRIYLKGGDDSVETRGGQGAGIAVRVIGGGGDDRYVDDGGGVVRFYDHRGDNSIDSRRFLIDDTDYDRPESGEPLHRYARDWGSLWRTLPLISVQPDIGLRVGLYANRWRYGFRADPYRSRLRLSGDFAAGVRRGSLGINFDLQEVLPGVDFEVDFDYSGFEIIRFHGFGNETDISTGARSDFRVARQSFSFSPGFVVSLGQSTTFSFGPVVKYASTENEARTILAATAPLGSGNFGQVGGRFHLKVDVRDRPVAASRGIMLSAGGSGFPGTWDAAGGSFAELHGRLAAYLSAPMIGRPTLALRVGGKKVFGTYPFHEAAFIGGADDLRGFAEQRFAGDAAVFGNAELRIALTATRIIVPGEMGLFGLVDGGRVFLAGESSTRVHTAFGGGLWFSFLGPMNTLSAGIARSEELTGFYLRSGFLF